MSIFRGSVVFLILGVGSVYAEQSDRPNVTASDVGHRKHALLSKKFYDAIARGKKDLVEFYIESGADVNSPLVNGKTPLMVAAEKGHIEVIKILIASGADKKTKFRDSASKEKTAYDLAEAAGKSKAAELLK